MQATIDIEKQEKSKDYRHWWIFLNALILVFVFTWWADIPQALWLFVGAGFGATLAATPLGFAGNWRRAVLAQDASGVAAHLLLLAAVGWLTIPLLSGVFGGQFFLFERPIGASLVFGSFVFGVGMQLGGSCTSGSLQRAGGGSLHAVLLILGFIGGGFYASAHYEWWAGQPNWAPVPLAEEVGWLGAAIFNTLLAGLLFLLLSKALGWRLQLSKQHFIGVALLVGLSSLAIVVLGHPWGIVNAFPLMAAKVYTWWNPDSELDFWWYWLQPEREEALAEPLLNDPIMVMNIGIVLGAALWVAWQQGWRWHWQLPWRVWLLAPVAGWMMGYGAILSYGCNIGSLLGGVASGSLHGWVWLACAFSGSSLACLLVPKLVDSMRSH